MNLRKFFSALVFGVLLVAGTISVVSAATLYIPFAGVKEIPPGEHPSITQDDCPTGFVLSRPYQNGTSSSFIYQELEMHPQDLFGIPVNAVMLTTGNISSITGESPICWLGDKYPNVFLEDVDEAEPLNIHFPEGRGMYLPSSVSVAQTPACTTLSVVLTTAEGTWQGAPIVGVLRRGFSQIIGKIVCNIATFVPEGIWSRAAYIYPVSTAAMQIYEASTQGGKPVPPTLFNLEGTAALFYYALDIEAMFVLCSMDAVFEADKLLIPRKRRMYMVGFENAGCVLADTPFFEGQVALPLDRLNSTMLLFTAHVQEQVLQKPMTPDEIQQLINDLQEELDSQLPDSDPEPEDERMPYWFPERNPDSCPDVYIPLYINDAVNDTLANVQYYLRYRTFPSTELVQLTLFASDAVERARGAKYEATYTVPQPRTDGALARLVSEADSIGRIWAVQLVCHGTEVGFVWILQPVGRANSGLLRSDKDNVDSYPYK